MKNLVNSLAKATGLSAEELTIAFESLQADYRTDIEELFTLHVGIDTTGHASDWVVDPGNFIEALMDNYTVEAR